ncbi:TPA: PepSY domain-containing protein [Legionella pneumophila]|nr:PepSY domain-containing protein [Legionella pneumophila]HCE5399457.1 PepSY domain-containing protein [Legionella pneumophila]HCE5582081.1 PepSY domain-containing protein [Legionella pneumophila]
MPDIKHYLKPIILFSGLLAAPFAMAEATKAEETSTVKLSTILQQLSDQGYKNIHDAEINDGVLTVEGSNEQGVKFEIHLDPATGKILKKQEHPQPKYSIIDITKKIETEGKFKIIEIEFDEGIYKIKGETDSHEKKELHIDPNTGETKTDH